MRGRIVLLNPWQQACHTRPRGYEPNVEGPSLNPIETKVRGDLVAEAKALQSDLWPSELGEAARDLLELYMHDAIPQRDTNHNVL
jgi:hypothetical protein